jgi:hypothetical protein
MSRQAKQTMKSWQRERRALLAKLGLGAACLPLLHPQRAWAAGTPPRRLVLIEMTQGLRQAAWRPAAGPLVGQTLPSSSAAFEPLKRDMIFLPDLTNPGVATTGRGAYGVMFYGLGATGDGEYKEPAGATLDQVVANGLPRAPGGRLTLNLGVQIDRAPVSADAPGSRRCFWTGPGQPITPLQDPFAVYQELFAGGNVPSVPDPAAVKRMLLRRKSILDSVGTNLDELRGRLGVDDRRIVDAHMQGVRELETRLQSIAKPDGVCGASPDMIDVGSDRNYPLVLRAQMDLMVAALKCGVTNVATLQTSDATGSNIDVSTFVPGIPSQGASARLSLEDVALAPVTDGVDFKRVTDAWFLTRIAELVAHLASVPEGGGTLLDNTIVVIANDMQEGANANAQAVPWMLAGKGGGALDTGNCLASAGRSTRSVMAGICEALGVTHPYGAVLPGLLKA